MAPPESGRIHKAARRRIRIAAQNGIRRWLHGMAGRAGEEEKGPNRGRCGEVSRLDGFVTVTLLPPIEGQHSPGLHAAATALCHAAVASARKIRSVDREMRWR